MNRKLLFLGILLFGIVTANGQSKEELESLKTQKEDSIKSLQGEVKDIQKQLDALPGWHIGVFGVIGGDISKSSNWYSQGTPNNNSGNIGFSVNAHANKIEEKYFWKNALTLNLKWVKLDDRDDPTDDDSFEPTTDIFNVSSLYGKKLTKSWAASAFGEYRTTLLDNFNNPGYLDLGIGFTWTPITDLFVVIHPLNYNFIFSDEDTVFESSLGAKIVGDYTRKIGNIDFKSNLSLFLSYKSSNYSNWTWTNSFSYTLWKKFGVGFEFGLRDNKQEALDYAINTLGDTNATFNTVNNNLQTYYTLGISYKF